MKENNEENGIVKMDGNEIEVYMADAEFKEAYDEVRIIEKMKNNYALQTIESALKQGEICQRILTKHGDAGLKALCSGNGFSRTTGYKLVKLYQIRDDEKLLALSLSGAYQYSKLKSLPGTIEENGKLTLPDGTPFSMEKFQAMTAREQEEYIRKLYNKKKTGDDILNAMKESHKRQCADWIEEKKRLLKSGKEDDGIVGNVYDEMIGDIGKFTDKVSIAISTLMNNENDMNHLSKLQLIRLNELLVTNVRILDEFQRITSDLVD